MELVEVLSEEQRADLAAGRGTDVSKEEFNRAIQAAFARGEPLRIPAGVRVSLSSPLEPPIVFG